MKLDMEIRPKDIVLLKILGCVLIAFFMIRFLIMPGIEKHMELSDQKEEVSIQQQDMQDLISRKDALDAIIANQQSVLQGAQSGYYDLLENSDVDELITGIVLKDNLFPVYLEITGTTDGVPIPYSLTTQNVSDQSGEESSAADTSDTENSTSDTNDSTDTENGGNTIQNESVYVHTTSVNVTVQGSEAQIRTFLDDIVRNYPGIQVTGFQIQENSYVDSSLQTVSQLNCNCSLAVYTCGENEG